MGALEVSQDLADDLDLAQWEAATLCKAVTVVKAASSDFRGADLRSVDLDGVLLRGIRWDGATVWPTGWEERIRRASRTAAEDRRVLIVDIEPHEITVPADI
ncbi:hypothetical protein [Streptomyces scopuliridis]|uniref:hypothetical protein n=1 Tax=Streptomyces scopuliridis TaxID=452529 RepID=UPI0036A04554